MIKITILSCLMFFSLFFTGCSKSKNQNAEDTKLRSVAIYTYTVEMPSNWFVEDSGIKVDDTKAAFKLKSQTGNIEMPICVFESPPNVTKDIMMGIIKQQSIIFGVSKITDFKSGSYTGYYFSGKYNPGKKQDLSNLRWFIMSSGTDLLGGAINFNGEGERELDIAWSIIESIKTASPVSDNKSKENPN